MAFVRPHRNASGAVVLNVYDRVTTEADATRFFSAEVGVRQLIHKDDLAVLPNGVARVVHETSLGTGVYRYELDFSYIVGAGQLQVEVADTPQYGVSNRIRFEAVATIQERTLALNGWTGPDASKFETYFEEIGSSTVRVYGVPSDTGMVRFSVPHTSIPAVSRNKIIVRDQGDNQAIELLGNGDGVLLRSPRGNRFLLRVDDSGVLVTEPR